jgi:hypothetical protein
MLLQVWQPIFPLRSNEELRALDEKCKNFGQRQRKYGELKNSYPESETEPYEKKSKIHPKANLVVHQIIVGVKNVVGGKDNKNR